MDAAAIRLRRATFADLPALGPLIAASARELSRNDYAPEQVEGALRGAFGTDTQLIRDGSYFVIETGGRLAGCGGWSRRRTLFGGDQAKRGPDPLLDPARDPARIRAFFVDPALARRGLGRQLLAACIDAARSAGFHTLELVSTLPGEPLYAACGFSALERFALDLPGNVRLPVVRMRRNL